jgi:uncharacterized protein (DUF2147 family)
METMKANATTVLFILPALFLLQSFVKLADPVEGVWYNDTKTAKIQIYKGNDEKFYGKIIWLHEPLKNGKIKTDEKNPKAALQSQPLIGLPILKGFEKDGNTYTDGTIYDPETGKTYDCKMTYKGKTLNIRGYIGISLIGRSAVWERAEVK